MQVLARPAKVLFRGEVGHVDDQGAALPPATRVAVPLPNVCGQMRPAVQRDIALLRACKVKRQPTDLGFFRDSTLDELRAVFTIPDSELIGDRLPWGLFRARAIDDQLHAGNIDEFLFKEPVERQLRLRYFQSRQAAETSADYD